MGRGTRGLVVVALAVLAGASTFCGGATFESEAPGLAEGGAGIDASADGPTTGDDGATGPDGPPASDGPEHGRDGQGAPDDASLDGAGVDANAPFSCANMPAALFCSDFDTGTKPESAWSQALAFGNGVNAFDTKSFRSAPRGYAASTPLTTAAADASLVETLAKVKAGTIDYAFSFLVTQLDTTFGTYATIARIAVGFPRQIFLDLQLDSAGLHLVQTVPQSDGGEATRDDVIHAPFATGTWTRVRVTLDRSQSPAMVKVVFDEATTFSTAALPVLADSTDVEVDLGILYVKPPNGGAALTFDDVIVRGL